MWIIFIGLPHTIRTLLLYNNNIWYFSGKIQIISSFPSPLPKRYFGHFVVVIPCKNTSRDSVIFNTWQLTRQDFMQDRGSLFFDPQQGKQQHHPQSNNIPSHSCQENKREQKTTTYPSHVCSQKTDKLSIVTFRIINDETNSPTRRHWHIL